MPTTRQSAHPLTYAALMQLLAYVNHCQSEGWYWGNEAQFRRRHEKIKAWLTNLIEEVEQKDGGQSCRR